MCFVPVGPRPEFARSHGAAEAERPAAMSPPTRGSGFRPPERVRTRDIRLERNVATPVGNLTAKRGCEADLQSHAAGVIDRPRVPGGVIGNTTGFGPVIPGSSPGRVVSPALEKPDDG